MGRKPKNDEFDKLAKKYKLTDKQRLFAEYYVYVTGLDGPAAVKLAEYSTINENYKFASEDMKEIYDTRQTNKIARDLLDNKKVLGYIGELRKNLENHLIVDKLWVLDNLKKLAMSGCETTKIRALELIGKSMEMFTEKTKVESVEDPGAIAREAFKKRMENTVEFKKRQENE